MTENVVQGLIGNDQTSRVRDMGGVMSILISRSIGLILKNELTPNEGLRIFSWCVKKEAELKKDTPKLRWDQIVRDSMDGQELSSRGEGWYKDLVNEFADSSAIPRPY